VTISTNVFWDSSIHALTAFIGLYKPAIADIGYAAVADLPRLRRNSM
jgi:hypothetical protein